MKKNLRYVVLGFFLCFLGVIWSGCERSSLAREENFETYFPITLGTQNITVRVALTDLERQRGLTGCQSLAENSGMLFIYPNEERRGFWMRGVPMGLSIGFFDSAGTLLESREMRANDLEVTYSRSEQVKFVLEMSSGWFSEHGIRAGTPLRLSELADAVSRRGFLPKKFEIYPEK